MKKLTLILLSVLMIAALAACGNKCKHTYDNACDVTCNECGEERTVTHDFADADCLTPKTCTVCGKTEGSALGHEWTTPDVDLCEVRSTCSRCGATDGENKEHTPAEDDGDCTTEQKCTVCGDVTTPAGQHIPNDDDGDCLTEITCSVCGTVTTPARDSHTGGTATCTEKAVCTACGTAYGAIDVNNHIDENTDHTCDRECGNTDIGTHADSAEDNDHVCDYGCGVILEDHEGGHATCAAQKVCTICGNGYGNLLDHNFTYTANDDANTITESCDKGCGHNKTITLKAPENLAYDSIAKEAVVDGSIDAKYTVTYDKNDVINVGTYKATLTVGEVSVSLDFEITKATPKVTAPTANTLTYNGEAQALVNAGSTDFGTMLYSLTEDGEYTTSIPQGTNAGDYTVWYYVQGNENANDSAVASVTVAIAKAVASITAAPTPNTLTYIGEAQYLINAGEANVGTMVYSLTEDGEYTTSIPQGTNAGDHTVWYYVQGDANHNDSAKATVSVNIAKAPVTVTADAKIKSYGDEDPTLTYTAEGLFGGDTLSSALTGTLSREEGENVGSYAITLGTLSADNYTISYEGADFTIQAKEVTDPTVTLDQTSYQYDGNVKEPKVISVVVDGRTLTEGIDYTVSYEDNVYVNTEAKVVINFMGNYDGTFKKHFTITQDPDTTEFDGEWITVPKAQ